MNTAKKAIVIGTGQSGPALAARLTKQGMKTAVIERKLIGGTCVNVGCVPTMALVASARAAHMARRGADFGVTIAGAVNRPITLKVPIGSATLLRVRALR